MTGYFLSPAQIEWVKNNIKQFSEKVTFDIGKILVIDNRGGIMNQVVLYITEGDCIEFFGDILVYDMASIYGETVANWEDIREDKSRYWFNQGRLVNTIKDRIALLNPSELSDNDRKFGELKQLISRC